MSTDTEKMEVESGKTYTPGPNAIDISPDQDKKILKEILVEGQGEERPLKGNKVSVHYAGKLTDGTQFDSSIDRGEKFEFTIGEGLVIRAWDIGVATMRKGEKCILTCHPDYAYGEKGSPPKIPESSTLVFEIELFDWEMEDLSPKSDGGILRAVITSGDGSITPSEGAVVEVHLVGKCGDKQFEERDVKFELGDGSEAGIVDGVEIALKSFKEGEISKLIIAPQYAYGSGGNSQLSIPPNSTVEYEVTLKSFEKEKEAWNMSSEEKLEHSEIYKTKGTNFFKKDKYENASKQYQKIIDCLQYESEMEGEKKDKKNSLLCAGYLNLAACFLKLNKYDEVIKNCDKALDLEPTNVKGLFRKGQAYLAIHEFDEAKESFELVLKTDPSNKAAQRNLFLCRDNLKKQLDKEKKMYQTMFKKMAAEEDSEPDSASGDANTQANGVEENMETEAAAETVAV